MKKIMVVLMCLLLIEGGFASGEKNKNISKGDDSAMEYNKENDPYYYSDENEDLEDYEEDYEDLEEEESSSSNKEVQEEEETQEGFTEYDF